MKREIKFRAKRKDNGEWVYGDLIQDKYSNDSDYTLIMEKTPCTLTLRVRVHSETVCQYTGLNDRNGKEIYEGDICKADVELYSNGSKQYIIYWQNGCFYADDKSPSGNLPLSHFPANNKKIEVIGNIYDNQNY